MPEQEDASEIVALVLERVNQAISDDGRAKKVRRRLGLWFVYSVVIGCLGLLANAVVLLAQSKFSGMEAFKPTDVYIAAAIIAAAATGDLVTAKIPETQSGMKGVVIGVSLVISALDSILYWVFKDPGPGPQANGLVTFLMFLFSCIAAAVSVSLAAGR
jgi:hypothetical protein